MKAICEVRTIFQYGGNFDLFNLHLIKRIMITRLFHFIPIINGINFHKSGWNENVSGIEFQRAL